jgi:hypothetical protein
MERGRREVIAGQLLRKRGGEGDGERGDNLCKKYERRRPSLQCRVRCSPCTRTLKWRKVEGSSEHRYK